LTSDELTFRPRPGEAITIAQRFRDGHTVILLALPEGASPEVAAPGVHWVARGHEVVLSCAAEVVPSERAEELTGILTVSQTIEASELASRLSVAATSARLVIGTDSVEVGPPFDRSRTSASLQVPLPGGNGASLLFPGPARATRQWELVGVLALLSVSLFVRALTKQRPRALEPDDAVGATPARPPATALLPPASAHGTVGLAPAPAPLVGPRPHGQRIGRYAILRQLGQGGMAEVFLARSEGEAGFGKLVALKVLQPSFAAQPAAVELFLDEARLVSGLDHPNIVQTHDLGRAGDRYFIAMEYVDGSDLARLEERLRQRGGRFPVPLALAILCRICDGLHAAHTAIGPDGQWLHLVHRDVKSANVFLSRTGAVKIGDFGIAKATHAVRMSRSELGQVKGTPTIMPPEQRRGLDVDLRADVYGVGAIAYEILSGEPVNLDYVALAAQGQKGWPHLPPLSARRADVPPALDAIIVKALAFAREARFADCAALEQALQTLTASVGVWSDKELGAWVRSQLDREATSIE
jgi:serine/threonine-protein kinase